jgi:N-terminal half of MaoC dehydratase
MNPAAEGTTYPAVPFVVDPSRVAAFRSLFGISEGVPPTFVTAAEFAAFPQIAADRHLDLDFSRVVHGSQAYRFRRALSEGEDLVVRARIESIRIRGGNGFVTIAMDLEDADGDVVCTARSQMVERAAGG